MATTGANGNSHAEAFESIIPLWINGEEVKTDDSLDVINPQKDEVIWKCSLASVEHAAKAVEAAQVAFPSWSKTKLGFRRNIFLRAADILESRSKELCHYMKVETGADDFVTSVFNVSSSVEMLRDIAGRLMTITSFAPVTMHEGRSAMVFKEPYGVVFGIAPWNGPYILGFRAVLYALATGNTTILKGSELSPRCFWAIGSVLHQAGLPDGCLNVIIHRPEDAAKITTMLIEHPLIKKINFTGSTAVGSIIAAQAGKNLKPVLMELGGKASTIVLEDADIEKAAKGCAMGAFLHTGQICMSTERILVHKSIASEFSTALHKAVKDWTSSRDTPALITSGGADKNRALLTNALSNGARMHSGDIESIKTQHPSKRMPSMVIEGVTKDMDLYHQESFGNSVSLFVVESEDEAIRLANDTEYGLSSAVFTKDLAAGLRVAKQIHSGAVHINNPLASVHDEPSLPHGGINKSGFGRFNGNAGLEEFLVSKTVTWED